MRRRRRYHPADPLYIRFGEWPEDEQSGTFFRGHIEERTTTLAGVSVYKAAYDAKANCYLYTYTEPDPTMTVERLEQLNRTAPDRWRNSPRPTRQTWTTIWHRPIFLVTGEVVGTGWDGEPVLRDVHIVGYGMHVFLASKEEHRIVPVSKEVFDALHLLKRAVGEHHVVGVFIDQPYSFPIDAHKLHEEPDNNQEVLKQHLPVRSLLERYRPQKDWFACPDQLGGIHGMNHMARVLVLQELLARLLKKRGVYVDQEALRWAAVTHDTQRLNDGPDPQHGERAGGWVKQRLQGLIPAKSLDTVRYLNTWHVPSDRAAPRMTNELSILKDADAVDRVRFGPGAVNVRLLRSDISDQILYPQAEILFRVSEQKQRAGYGPFDCVIAAAVELGIVIDE